MEQEAHDDDPSDDETQKCYDLFPGCSHRAIIPTFDRLFSLLLDGTDIPARTRSPHLLVVEYGERENTPATPSASAPPSLFFSSLEA
jgi:hypothetical protein